MPTGVYPRAPKVADLPSVCHPDNTAFVGTQCRRCYELRANAEDPTRLERNRASARERYRRQPAEKRRGAIIAKYGLTVAAFELLLKQQRGCCALCSKDVTGSSGKGGLDAQIDHDHLTGRVRGLLCRPCNTSIGQLGDTIEGLERAITYLRRRTTP